MPFEGSLCQAFLDPLININDAKCIPFIMLDKKFIYFLYLLSWQPPPSAELECDVFDASGDREKYSY